MSNPWETSNPWGKGSKEWNRWMAPEREKGNPLAENSALDGFSLGTTDITDEPIFAAFNPSDCQDVLRDFTGWESVTSDWAVAIDYGAYNVLGQFQRANVVSETFYDVRWQYLRYPRDGSGKVEQYTLLESGLRSLHVSTREVYLDLNGKFLDDIETLVFYVLDENDNVLAEKRTQAKAGQSQRSSFLERAVRFTSDYLDPKSGHGIPTPNYLTWQREKRIGFAEKTIGALLLEELVISKIKYVKDLAKAVKLLFDLRPVNLFADSRELMATRTVPFLRSFFAFRPEGTAKWELGGYDPGRVFSDDNWDVKVSTPCWVPEVLFLDYAP